MIVLLCGLKLVGAILAFIFTFVVWCGILKALRWEHSNADLELFVVYSVPFMVSIYILAL
ncbi:hypothetical protein COV24_02595 [candidate division WWE3 bacterium CG10_big_fil_rev_8_21_14_0_10_32_10]|uniref:Uncharacterized protein n=1 Tax=candidate division WWE3 bacterium CG10_big_fil_rev_8_21_14_0_10_32_10 TaxID=1975090 RepID=A0A2H0RAB7_UNCKA|nr:MAG: hypothetical protein COV24_02595 [candidate division WWE3 bacterium CG10_big_fil_rev_8_21_14_0_10_32_10]